jgi:hypothetical protein
MDLTPKQQTSEAIRQAETIVIVTGQHPSIDQITAVIGLAAILRKFGKRVSPVISDSLPASVQTLDTTSVERNLGGMRDFVLKVDVTKAEVDKLRYEVADGKLNIFLTPFKGNFAPSDVTFGYGDPQFEYDLAIVLGVPTRARIDKVYDQNASLFEQIPLINLDFHRSNENYGAVNLIEPNASSLCEMLVALSESLQGGIIDADIATTLLMGIVGSTDRFTAAHTTSKSLTVAAQMMAAGARQQAVVRALYRDNKSEQSRSDRPDRSDKNDSRGDRDGNRDRNQSRSASQDRSGGGQDRRNNPQPQASAQPQPQPQAQPPVQPVAPSAEQTATMQPPVQVAPPAPVVARVEREMEPIIQPGHIEFSDPAESLAPFAPQPADTTPMSSFAAAEIRIQPESGESRPAQP